MIKRIAVSGKGGTGKTTFVSMVIRCLMEEATKPILAVDADPNACLGITLGLEPQGTIADIRDEVINKKKNNPGLSKLQEFELGCQHSLTEAKGYDLLTMGRPEGPKCYCAANNVLRGFLDEISSNYGYVITDNEAGMEHLSRRTTHDVDLLFIVGEPTRVGVVTAKRIVELTNSLPISIGEIAVIWNKTEDDFNVDVGIEGVDFYGSVPHDRSIMDVALEGKTIFDLCNDSHALKATREILSRKSLVSSI